MDAVSWQRKNFAKIKGKPEGRRSREITKKHRMVYRIIEEDVYVDVLSAYGHYDDK
ncbi:MAG: type II toxin-antitoxin system YoeB family toxin [Bacteroidaceae bacterium]|nr:type II toxin-antitoxin system YoeB family toxin [Bacteroidaceae bacterium]